MDRTDTERMIARIEQGQALLDRSQRLASEGYRLLHLRGGTRRPATAPVDDPAPERARNPAEPAASLSVD
jgi:hypothetical protein